MIHAKSKYVSFISYFVPLVDWNEIFSFLFTYAQVVDMALSRAMMRNFNKIATDRNNLAHGTCSDEMIINSLMWVLIKKASHTFYEPKWWYWNLDIVLRNKCFRRRKWAACDMKPEIVRFKISHQTGTFDAKKTGNPLRTQFCRKIYENSRRCHNSNLTALSLVFGRGKNREKATIAKNVQLVFRNGFFLIAKKSVSFCYISQLLTCSL